MPHWWVEYTQDILWVGGGVAVLVIYHLYLAWSLWHDPHFTVQRVNHAARRAWVRNIMSDPAHGILGVQTLRNSTMAATFFASTAVLLIMGVLTLSGQADKIASNWHLLNMGGSDHPGLWVIKLLVLLVDLLVAFFSFAIAVRLFNHVGYQVTLPPPARPPFVTPDLVARHLNHAGFSYSLGMRAYFLAIPLVFWLFGPHLMAVASLLTVLVLHRLDRMGPDAPG